MGARPYRLVTTLGERGAVVEIGSERGEGSTDYLSDLCRAHGVPFFSVDIAPRHQLTTVMDGEAFLAEFADEIQLAYLDNFDFVFPEIEGLDWVDGQISEYRALGYEMSNDNSMSAHLAQAKLVHERSFVDTVVLFDDTYMLDGRLHGKGATAVPWMLDHGWALIGEIGDHYSTGYARMRRER